MASTIYFPKQQADALIETCNSPVLCNFITCISWFIYTMAIRLAWFQFIDDSAASWKMFLNFSEGAEYGRRKLKCISILKWAEPLPKLFSKSGLQGWNFKNVFVSFCFYIVARIVWKTKKARRKGYQGIIQLL